MALKDAIVSAVYKNSGGSDNAQLPPLIEQRMKRGRKEMTAHAHKRRLCAKFEKGESYWYLNQDGLLRQQSTVTSVNGGGKPAHRIRMGHNFIRPIVDGKVSAATQRVPSYEVLPSSSDQERVGAAKLAEQVAVYGYDKWGLRQRTTKTVKLALVQGAGFCYPYFDRNVGPYVETANGAVGFGEVKHKILSPQQVYWEPGVDFDESPWWAFEEARPIDEVKATPGYLGGPLKPDANVADLPSDTPSDNLVIVTEYLQRPNAENPQGLRLISAGGRLIFKAEPYPLHTPKGDVLDEPCIHRLVYTHDPDTDVDFGLVWQLIDPQRVAQDCLNKACVSGETLITTRGGLRRADEMDGAVDVLTVDGTYRTIRWGRRAAQRLYRVEFSDGSHVYATDNHRWLTRRGGRDAWETTRTVEGCSIPYGTLAAHTPVSNEDEWFRGVQRGLMWGDGTVEHHRRGEREYVYGSIRQYGSEDNVAVVERFFENHTERRDYGHGLWIQARGVAPELKSIPDLGESHDYLRGFIAGAIASDGCTTGGEVKISQKSRADLEAVEAIARSVGIATRPIRDRGDWHELFLDRRSFVSDDGADERLVLKPYHRKNLEDDWGRARFRRTPCRRVVSVTATDRFETTYCGTEPVTSTFVLGNGLVTGNSEWKNRCLIPQWIAEEGSLLAEPNDEPGWVNYFKRGTRNPPTREEVPPIPDSLFRLFDVTHQNMREIGADAIVDASPDVAAKTVQQVVEQSNARWASFIGDLAEWHSRVMRHSLLLVACYYTEARLLQVRGRTGFAPIEDFKGADLMNQTDVIVFPGSLTYRTRDQIKQDVFAYADRGWISPEQAMAAIDGGNAESLIQSYQLDIARANRVIQKIRDGSVMDMAPRTMTDKQTGMPMMDPQTGAPLEIPGYMPSEWDNLKVWKSAFGDFLKTDEFDRLDPAMQEVAKQIWEGLGQLELQRQLEAQAAQNAAAEQQGMANAARPVPGKDMPSLPGGSPAPGGDGSPTAQQPPGA